MGCGSGCSRSPDRAAGEGAAGQHEAGRGSPVWQGGGGDLGGGAGRGAEVPTAALLLGWRRAESGTLAAGPALGGHGQPEPGGLLSTLTARVTLALGPSPSNPGFMPEAVLEARPPTSGAQPGLGLLLGCR